MKHSSSCLIYYINNGRPRDKKILGFSIIRHLLQQLMGLVLVMCFCVQVGVPVIIVEREVFYKGLVK